MPDFYSFTIPNWHPILLNKIIGRHWGKAAKIKKLDQELIWAYARIAGVPTAKGPRKVMLDLHFKKYTTPGDTDAYYKILLDQLVHARLLVDDSPKWCAITPPTFYFNADKKETKITLVEIADTGNIINLRQPLYVEIRLNKGKVVRFGRQQDPGNFSLPLIRLPAQGRKKGAANVR